MIILALQGIRKSFGTHEVLRNASLTLQESEVQAVKWADEQEVLQMLMDGRLIPYHRAFIQLLFALRDSQGAHVSRLG